MITDSGHPVQVAAGTRVIELDLPARIEAELAAGLPTDPPKRLASCSNAPARRAGKTCSAASVAPTRTSRMPGAWASPRCPPWSSIGATWSMASRMLPAAARASKPIGGYSHDPPVVAPIAPPAHGGGLAAVGRRSLVFALDTATIVTSALSPDCLEYRVVGICCWLFCTPFGCSVRTSVKVRHYVPDAVVSSYSNTGENPWIEVRPMSVPNPTARAGGDGTTNHDNENNLAKFKNADVIGHPAGSVFSQFASASGYTCQGAGTAFMPYLLSTFDTLAWRYNVPEMVYPEALIPGMREIGGRTTLNLWGNVYPRGGFLHQTDDYKSGAVVAQRAGDIVTRRTQPHVYQPLLATAHDGYWPAGARGDRRIDRQVAGADADALDHLRGLPAQQYAGSGPTG